MKTITRNINFDHARDLLERVPRACLSFARDGCPQAHPVRLLWREGRYYVGLSDHTACPPEPAQEAVLLVDEGIYFYDLRALYVRGQLQPTTLPDQEPTGRMWFELLPLKIVAWDYGTLREVDDEYD